MKLLPRLRPMANRRWKGIAFGGRFPLGKRSSSLCGRRRCLCLWWCNCCSAETLHVLVKLFLLCVASCSWSLLIISLSLSTSHQPSRRFSSENEVILSDEEKESNPCLSCKTHEGPSKAFARNFHRPLLHILSSVNKLDLPLVSSDLRIHLTILRVLLVQLLKTLKVSMTHEKRPLKHGPNNTVLSEYVESRDAIRKVDRVFERNRSNKLACPDHYLGSLAGYPRYKRGFIIRNCSAAKLEQTMSIIMWNVDKSTELMKHWTNKTLSVFLVSNSSWQVSNPFINIVSPNPSIEKSLRSILKNISTPYVLLAPGLHSLRDETNFNRLMYVSDRTRVAAVSGSIRAEEDGRWRSGCQLFKEAEGHIAFKRSYSASDLECQLCHFAEGPILIRTKWLTDSGWPPDNARLELLMPSLFFNLNQNAANYEHPILVCPDVMFYYHSLDTLWDKESLKSTFRKTKFELQNLWESTAKSRRLTKISLASGTKLHYPCHYLDTTNLFRYDLEEAYFHHQPFTKTGLRICQEFELEYIMTRIIKSCDNLKLICVLQGPFIQILIHAGDPLMLLQLGNKSPEVSIKVLSKNRSFNGLHELLRNEKFKGVFREANVLRVDGNYWHVKITQQAESDQLIYRRLRVLDSLWMNSEFSANATDPSSFLESLGNSRISSQRDSTAQMIRNHDTMNRSLDECLRPEERPDIVFSNLSRDEEGWELFSSEKCS